MAIDAAPRLRARHLALALALFLTYAPTAIARDEFRDRSVIGTWKLVSVLDLASIASLDEAEAKTLLGKFLTISETAVQVDAELCSKPEFWAERVVPEPHMQEKLHSSAERLRLPNPATMVELGCTDVYIRSPGQLVLLWGGAMFDAVRIDPARRQPSKARSATTRPVAKAKPGTAQKAVIRKPSAVKEPSILKQPPEFEKPLVVKKPPMVKKPVVANKPTTPRKPGKPPGRKAGTSTGSASAVNELF